MFSQVASKAAAAAPSFLPSMFVLTHTSVLVAIGSGVMGMAWYGVQLWLIFKKKDNDQT